MIEEHEQQETSVQDLIDLVERDDLPTNEFTTEDTDPMVLLGKLNEVIAYLQTLQTSISSSDTKATQALSQAIQAMTDATQALSVANGIDNKATMAMADASQSLVLAEQAVSIASQARSTASTANTNSTNAISTANGAVTTANSAVTTANSAVTTANSADTKADTAISTANQAEETANGIDAKATQALTNSQTAITTANSAETTAQEALDQVVAGLGTKVYRNSQLLNTLDIKPIEDDITDNATAITNNATAITNLSNNKVDKVTGKQLSTEDFTTTEKTKLAGLNNYDDTQVRADITALQTGKQPVGNYITQGGTLTAPLKVTGGDSATAGKIILDTNGQITDTSTATLFGRTGNGSTLTAGHSSYALTLRGSATRPTYNGSNMALSSDMPTKTSQLTNDSGFLTQHQDISGKADKNNSSQSITAGTMTATTGNFTNINTSLNNISTIVNKLSQYGYVTLWENQGASSKSASVTRTSSYQNKEPLGLLYTGKTSGTIHYNFLPYQFVKNQTRTIFYMDNRDAYIGGTLSVTDNGTTISISSGVISQGGWSSGTQSCYLIF